MQKQYYKCRTSNQPFDRDASRIIISKSWWLATFCWKFNLLLNLATQIVLVLKISTETRTRLAMLEKETFTINFSSHQYNLGVVERNPYMAAAKKQLI